MSIEPRGIEAMAYIMLILLGFMAGGMGLIIAFLWAIMRIGAAEDRYERDNDGE